MRQVSEALGPFRAPGNTEKPLGRADGKTIREPIFSKYRERSLPVHSYSPAAAACSHRPRIRPDPTAKFPSAEGTSCRKTGSVENPTAGTVNRESLISEPYGRRRFRPPDGIRFPLRTWLRRKDGRKIAGVRFLVAGHGIAAIFIFRSKCLTSSENRRTICGRSNTNQTLYP